MNKTSLYRKDPEPSEEEVRIKHLIDRIHIERPARGSRGIRDDIKNMKLGFRVNRKRIQRYMQEMGIQAFYPGPNLSKRITCTPTCCGIQSPYIPIMSGVST